MMTDREIARWAVSEVDKIIKLEDKDARQFAYYAALFAAQKASNEELKNVLLHINK